MFEVNWIGDKNIIFKGNWIIKYGGVEFELPDTVMYSNMGTYGEYKKYDCDCKPVYYSEGDLMEAWVAHNRWWLKPLFSKHNINFSTQNLNELYTKIQEKDFRVISDEHC